MYHYNPELLVQWTADLFQLKEPIPFDKVKSNPWLLDSSTDLADYANQVFRAEKLLEVWANRDEKHLHAVLRIGSAF